MPMPGVTVDMLDWWFAWHSLASMHYGIWYPPGHFAISISESHRRSPLILRLEPGAAIRRSVRQPAVRPQMSDKSITRDDSSVLGL